MSDYTGYILPVGLAIAAILVLPTLISLVGAGIKTLVGGVIVAAVLGSSAFASFQGAASDRVDQEIDRRASTSSAWQTVKTTRAETRALKRKLDQGESKIYRVAGVKKRCARQLARSSSTAGKAKAYVLYCEDGRTYRSREPYWMQPRTSSTLPQP